MKFKAKCLAAGAYRGKIYAIYDVHNFREREDSKPWFLIFDGDQGGWQWMSSEYFTPEE